MKEVQNKQRPPIEHLPVNLKAYLACITLYRQVDAKDSHCVLDTLTQQPCMPHIVKVCTLVTNDDHTAAHGSSYK